MARDSAQRITDHPFQGCGAGTRTSDNACYVVRELGGNRDLCHADSRPRGYVGLMDVCQRPKEDHEP